MDALNTIALVPATHGKLTYLEIEVDGVPLAHYFAGRTGAHPSHLSPLGWSSASAGVNARIREQLLAKETSALESGRVPVLVCEECGAVIEVPETLFDELAGQLREGYDFTIRPHHFAVLGRCASHS